MIRTITAVLLLLALAAPAAAHDKSVGRMADIGRMAADALQSFRLHHGTAGGDAEVQQEIRARIEGAFVREILHAIIGPMMFSCDEDPTLDDLIDRMRGQ